MPFSLWNVFPPSYFTDGVGVGVAVAAGVISFGVGSAGFVSAGVGVCVAVVYVLRSFRLVSMSAQDSPSGSVT